MPIKLGEYSVRSGNKNIKFYPLVPGTTIAVAATPTRVAPNQPNTNNTITPQPAFGIFDIVIRFSEELVETEIEKINSTDRLQTRVAGLPQVDLMPLAIDDEMPPTNDDSSDEKRKNREINISFAVPIVPVVPIAPEAAFFEGVLQLKATNRKTGKDKILTLPLKIKSMERAADMFIFFIVHTVPEKEYCWLKLPITAWASQDSTTPAQPISGAKVTVKVLRDNPANPSNGYKDINRRVKLASDANGFITSQIAGNRPVLGLPIKWALIFNATKDELVPRGHMIRLERNNISNNLAPYTPSAPFRMMKISKAKELMAKDHGKTVMLDPGHGVVYHHTQRRSEEWFIAHKIADRIAVILKDRYGLLPQNLFWTRSAGFGLIEPTKSEIKEEHAPEHGLNRYAYDPATRRFSVKAPFSLSDLSDFLLTAHQDDGTVISVTEAERNRLISVNQAAVNAIITRLNDRLASHRRRVQEESVRWEVVNHRYIYTIELINPAPGQNPVVGTEPFSIDPNDWFEVDDEFWTRIARRTALWSITKELGSSGGVHKNKDLHRPEYGVAIRAVMRRYGVLDYMVQKIKEELSILPENLNLSDYNQHNTMGWSPAVRVHQMNQKNCDITLTLHENSGGGVGTAIQVTAPPLLEQVKSAKIFLKYVDPFDKGIRGEHNSIQPRGSDVGLLTSRNQIRDKYLFFELEFLDGENPADPSQYTYEVIITKEIIDNTAEQIVAGVIEFLFDQQEALDDVTQNYGKVPNW